MNNICERCKYMELNKNECRRRAPNVFYVHQYEDEKISFFPDVQSDDWCGEWKEK